MLNQYMRNLAFVAAISVAGIAIPVAAAAKVQDSAISAPADSRLAPIRDEILAMVEKGEIPGMAVGVMRGHQLLWLEGMGHADVESKKPMTPDTIQPIASVSKSIATSLLMILVSDGTIDLDQEVGPLIAPLKLRHSFVDDANVTVRQVISMTAGIGHGWFGAESYDALPPEEELFSWYGNIAYPAGRNAHYSNWSAGLAGLIVETVTGLPLEQFAQQRLFGPLSMHNSYTRLPVDRIGDVATGYNTSMNPLKISDEGFSIPAGGVGMFSTARDLLHFGMYHAGSLTSDASILNEEAIRAMRDAPTLGPSYAMGFHHLGGPLISNGNTNRITAELQIFPDEDLVIAITLNRASWDMLPNQIAGKIAKVLRGEPTPTNLSQEAYIAEWETAYDGSTAALEGEWHGAVVNARTGEAIPVSLAFVGDKAVFRYREAAADLRNMRLNSHNQFLAAATIDDFVTFRDGEDPVAGLNFELLRTGEDELVGYVRMDRGEADYFYAIPVAIRLARSRD